MEAQECDPGLCLSLVKALWRMTSQWWGHMPWEDRKSGQFRGPLISHFDFEFSVCVCSCVCKGVHGCL